MSNTQLEFGPIKQRPLKEPDKFKIERRLQEGDQEALASYKRLHPLWVAFLASQQDGQGPTSLLALDHALRETKILLHEHARLLKEDQPQMQLATANLLKALVESVHKRLSQERFAAQIVDERNRYEQIRAVFVSARTLDRARENHLKRGPRVVRPGQPAEAELFSLADLPKTLKLIRDCLTQQAEPSLPLSVEEQLMIQELRRILDAYDAQPIDTQERSELAALQQLQHQRETASMHDERRRFETLKRFVDKSWRLRTAYEDFLQKGDSSVPLEAPEHTLLTRLLRYHQTEERIFDTLLQEPDSTDPVPEILAEPVRRPLPFHELEENTNVLSKRLKAQLAHPPTNEDAVLEELQWDQLHEAYSTAIQYKEDLTFAIPSLVVRQVNVKLHGVFDEIDQITEQRLDIRLKQSITDLERTRDALRVLELLHPAAATDYRATHERVSQQFSTARRRLDSIILAHPVAKIREPLFGQAVALGLEIGQRFDRLPRPERFYDTRDATA